MPNQSGPAANEPDDATNPTTPEFGPTDAEVEAWAQQERERREAWLRGPTPSQKSDWAARERGRRMAERGLDRVQRARLPRLPVGEDSLYMMQRYAREAQLAAEGAFSLMFSLSVRDVFDQLVQAGRDWEDEYASRPTRRRIPLDSDAGEAGPGAERTATSAGDSSGTAPQTS
jgi:hypothetical protein